MLPVTGPINRDSVTSTYTTTKRVYQQKMPVDRPLPYTFNEIGGRNIVSNWTGGYVDVKDTGFDAQSFFSDPTYTRAVNFARNSAYEKLRAGLGDQSGWAENVAQFGKTRQSIVERSVQAYKAVRAIKRLDFGRAAKILRTPVPSGVSNRKALAQNFLEYEYGWKPLVSDIQNSLEIITSDPSARMLYGSASEPLRTTYVSSSGNSTSGSFSSNSATATVRAQCGAFARITNPNVFLANQLGILDVALPWKLLPFSFVIDWFINVEQVLSSCTDWAGVTLQHQWSSTHLRGRRNYNSYSWWTTNPATPGNAWTRTVIWNTHCKLDRLTSIPGPTLTVKPFKGFSLQRGAQAISLVIAVLGK